MVLIYVDESGNPDYKDSEQLYSLTAILIKERDYKKIDTELMNFKKKCSKKYDLKENFEIHMREIVADSEKIEENEGKTLKSLSWEQKKEFLKNLFNTIKKLEFRIISVVVLKDKMDSEIDIRFWTTLPLIERSQMHIQKLFPKNFGIMLMDSENKEWNQQKLTILRDAIDQAYDKSDIEIKNIVPTMYFLDSSLEMGIQIADAVGWCIRRWIRYLFYGKGEMDVINNRNFNLIKNKIHEYPDCLQKGLKIIPKECLEVIKRNL